MSKANQLTEAQLVSFYRNLKDEEQKDKDFLTPNRVSNSQKKKTEERRKLEHNKELYKIELEFNYLELDYE